MQNLIGQSLGRYHIIEKLGEGGMAVVYKAYDTRLERDVAVKIIRSDLFGNAVIERMLKRFEREAKSMAKLSHANIVKVHDFGEHEGSPYLVMELLSGGTLKEQMGSPLPWQQAVSLLEPIARALAYAHGEGILHRDVKPANILITKTGEPVLTDFGIAKLLETEEGNTLTGTGVGVGTPEYMAPEQGLGKQVDGRADVYSLGIVLYELVTGRKPYGADTPLAVLLKQVNDPLPEPRGFVTELPEAVEKVLYKALAKNADDRYPGMQEFAAALKKLQAGEQTASAPVEKPAAPISNPDSGTYATVDQFDNPVPKPTPPARRAAVEPVRVEAIKESEKPVRPAWLNAKTLGIALGGVAVVVLAIGAGSGWFSPKMPVATEAPAMTEAAATEAATEAPFGIGSTMVSEVDGMTMVYVPAGEFTMGLPYPQADDNENPQHLVYLNAYWIDQTEVSNKMFQMFVDETGFITEAEKNGQSLVYVDNRLLDFFEGASWRQPQGLSSNIDGLEDHPVVQISWSDAKKYCEWAGRRLPTEAEWEKAARGTDNRFYPWGDSNPTDDLANFHGDAAVEVNSYPEGASPYGALNMAGNVSEWVEDWYADYPSEPVSNPIGPSVSSKHILRSGNWKAGYFSMRVTNRIPVSVSLVSDPSTGFRCAINAN